MRFLQQQQKRNKKKQHHQPNDEWKNVYTVHSPHIIYVESLICFPFTIGQSESECEHLLKQTDFKFIPDIERTAPLDELNVHESHDLVKEKVTNFEFFLPSNIIKYRMGTNSIHEQ